MKEHRVDLKWSLWSEDPGTWEEYAPAALADMEAAAAGGEAVRIYTAPRKEIRYGMVDIPPSGKDIMDQEYDRWLPRLEKVYAQLPPAKKKRVEQLDADFHEGKRAGFIAWAQGHFPTAFTRRAPIATNTAYVFFRTIWDAPYELVPDEIPDEARDMAEARIVEWFYNSYGFDESGEDPIGAAIDTTVTARSFEDLMAQIDGVEAALLSLDNDSANAFDNFLADLVEEFR